MIQEQIKYIGPSRLSEAEELFFSEMLINIKHADPDYSVVIDKGETVKVHIRPSDPQFKQAIIDNLLYFNRKRYKFRIHFSKSLKISQMISFEIS